MSKYLHCATLIADSAVKVFLLFVVCYLGYMRLLEEMLLQWHALVFFRSTVDIDKDLFTTMTFHIKSRLLVRIGGNSSSWHTCYFL